MANTFTYTSGGIPFWKWILSPVLVLSAEGNITIIAIILGLAGISYGNWIKWSFKFQLVILAVTTIILLLAGTSGY